MKKVFIFKKVLQVATLFSLAPVLAGCFGGSVNESVNYSGDLQLYESDDRLESTAMGLTEVTLKLSFTADRTGECVTGDAAPAEGSITLTDEDGNLVFTDTVTEAFCFEDQEAVGEIGLDSGSSWVLASELNRSVLEYTWGDEAMLIARGHTEADVAFRAGQTDIQLFNNTEGYFGRFTQNADPLTEARDVWQDAQDQGLITHQDTFNKILNRLSKFENRLDQGRYREATRELRKIERDLYRALRKGRVDADVVSEMLALVESLKGSYIG